MPIFNASICSVQQDILTEVNSILRYSYDTHRNVFHFIIWGAGGGCEMAVLCHNLFETLVILFGSYI